VVVLSDSRMQGACHCHGGTQIVIENLGNQHFQPFLRSVPMKRPGSKLSSVNKKNERSALPSFCDKLRVQHVLIVVVLVLLLGEPSRHYYDADPGQHGCSGRVGGWKQQRGHCNRV